MQMQRGLNATTTAAPAPSSSHSPVRIPSVPVASLSAKNNLETSRLGSVEFNTPYAHEIAGLAAILAVVVTASIVLAVRFTRRQPPQSPQQQQLLMAPTGRRYYDDNSSPDDTGSEGDEEEAIGLGTHLQAAAAGSTVCKYESILQQQQQADPDDCCAGGALFCFSARVDTANGLLCLHRMQLVGLAAWPGSQPVQLEDWTITIDIVAQTDAECRQSRLQTRPLAAAPGMQGTTDGEYLRSCWNSEVLDDVIIVRLNQSHPRPLRGQLLIKVVGQRPAIPLDADYHEFGSPAAHLLGSAALPVERLANSTSTVTSHSVALMRDTEWESGL